MEERILCIALIEEAREAGAREKKACELLEISPRTLQRWRLHPQKEDKQRGPRTKPANALSEEERNQIRKLLIRKEFRDKSPAQIVPMLADRGIYIASEATMYRILREEKLLTHRGKAKPRTQKKPDEKRADGPNQIWSWDVSYLKSTIQGKYFYLYMVMDVWSRKITGWAVHECESAVLGAELLEKAVIQEGVAQHQLIVHSDNGAPMVGATLQAKLEALKVSQSLSRPSVPDDNPYSESLFHTLKQRPEYPDRPFHSLEEAKQWVNRFTQWYHDEHFHSALNFVTPLDKHTGKDQAILAYRKEVYEQARQRHPERWSGKTRNWEPPEAVILNKDYYKNTA